MTQKKRKFSNARPAIDRGSGDDRLRLTCTKASHAVVGIIPRKRCRPCFWVGVNSYNCLLCPAYPSARAPASPIPAPTPRPAQTTRRSPNSVRRSRIFAQSQSRLAISPARCPGCPPRNRICQPGSTGDTDQTGHGLATKHQDNSRGAAVLGHQFDGQN